MMKTQNKVFLSKDLLRSIRTADHLMVVLIFLLLLSSCSSSKPQVMADKIIIHATIWTGNANQPMAQAMAIRGDTILAVGTDREILKYKNSETEVIESPGALITPGFIDSHLHFLEGGASLSSVILKDAQTREEFIDRIKTFAATMKPGEWMLEGYWDHENWGGELPSRIWIDEVTQNIPVFLNRSDGHMALANTAALNAAGIKKGVKTPSGGEIGRDEQGELTGLFRDNAMSLISNHIPDYSDEQYQKALDTAMNYVAQNGVTSVHHMGTLKDMEVFRTKLLQGGLKTRIYATGPLWQYKEILNRKDGNGDWGLVDSKWLKMGGAKLFADGSLGSKTAYFKEPYLDAPDERGLMMDEEATMQRGVLEADKAGLQVVIHAIGDQANHLVLNFYEEAERVNGPRDRRFRIEHAQHLLPEDVKRFGQLGVIASMQPWHLMDDGRWAERSIGKERAKTTYCFRSLLDGGSTLAFGSDWFVAPPDPMEGIFAAVTRQTLDGGHPNGWVPEEKITVEEALRAYTIDAAYASFDENIKGSLEPGKLADFVILDRNILTCPPEKIRDTQVLATYVGGEVIYKKK